MKVLLLSDIEKLGWFGDIVEVKTGYGRNYLLPHGLAVIPTESKIKALAEEKARRAQERALARKELEKTASEVEGAEAVIASKANEQGHLFGSVTAAQIAENLRAQGFAVADSVVKLGGPVKELGTHKVNLRFAEELSASVNVVVVSPQQEQGDQEQQEQEDQKEEPAAAEE